MGAPPSDRDRLAGWRIEGAVLKPDETVAGYMARDVDVRGRCYLRNCRRSYWFDYGEWIALGMGRVPLRRIQDTLRCHLLTGCNFYFEEKGGAALTLRFLDRDQMFVRIACARCHAFRLVRARTLIRKLETERRGGPETTLADLAGLPAKPCHKCKGAAWTVDAIVAGGARLPAWLQDELKKRQRRREDLAERHEPPG